MKPNPDGPLTTSTVTRRWPWPSVVELTPGGLEVRQRRGRRDGSGVAPHDRDSICAWMRLTCTDRRRSHPFCSAISSNFSPQEFRRRRDDGRRDFRPRLTPVHGDTSDPTACGQKYSDFAFPSMSRRSDSLRVTNGLTHKGKNITSLTDVINVPRP